MPINYLLMIYLAFNSNLSTILFFALVLVLGFSSGYIARIEDEE